MEAKNIKSCSMTKVKDKIIDFYDNNKVNGRKTTKKEAKKNDEHAIRYS